MKKLIYLFILLFFVSCYPTQQTTVQDEMNYWVGKPRHDLLLVWGVPSRTHPDGWGGEILLYEDLRRAYDYTFGMGYITVVHQYTFYIMNDTVYHCNYDRTARQGF
jgi:hypothetical protein